MSSAPSAAPEPEPLSIPHPPQHGLALLDQCIIGGYLIFAVLLGCYFSRSNNTTEAFFLGSRGLPGWALGLSLLSTSISSNSFLAIPAFSYANDFSLLLKDAVLPIPAVVAALLVVPFFRQEGRAGRWQGRQPWGRGAEQKPWGTAFEFLEDRFGSLTRRYAGLCYICVQMVRTASILYLISIPVSLFTGLSGEVAIVGTGCFVAFYSTLGGVRAVVFTDVVQAFILLGGGMGTVVVIANRLPDGFSTILTDANKDDKFNLVAGSDKDEFSFDDRTVYSVMATGLIAHLTSYTAGQDCVQRYLAASSLHEARKAIVVCAVMSIPTWSFFNLVGTALFSFYKHNPDPALRSLTADEVFPHFITQELPSGMAGVVVSGALAAAMSSLDSSLNAISSVVVVDFAKPLCPGWTDLQHLRLGRLVTVVTTVLMIVVALFFRSAEKTAMFDLFNVWTSVATGAAFSLFLVATLGGSFVDNATAIAAIGCSVFSNIYLAVSTNGLLPEYMTPRVDSYWTNVIVNAVFLLAAVAIGGARTVLGCSRKRSSSRYGEFKLVSDGQAEDRDGDSLEAITPGGRGQFQA